MQPIRKVTYRFMLKDLLYRKTFDRIYTEQYARIYRYAFQITNDAEASRDIAGDVFMGLWKNIASIDMERLNAYLLTSTRNRCTDHLRHAQLVSHYAEEYVANYSEVYTDYADEQDKDELVSRMMSQLPEPTHRILELCYFHRQKYTEVAEELNISPNTVKKHIVKALKMLKELYNNQNREE